MTDTDIAARQLELAQATVANTIMYCAVEREAAGWKILAPVPAQPGSGVTLDLGMGRQEAGTIHGATFAEALDSAIAAGVDTIADPRVRYAELLTAWRMQPF